MTKLQLRLILAALLAFGASYSVSALLNREPQTSRRPDPLGYIISPKEWVPLTYDVALKNNGVIGGTRFRIYRSGNGSTHTISTAGAVETHQLDNTVLKQHIRWTAGGRGFVHPLRAQGVDRRLLTIGKSRLTEVPPNDARVSALSNLPGQRSFWEFVGSDGTRFVYCPELNLLDVFVDLGGGKTKEVVNIVLGEPDSGLFLPPPNVALEPQPDPRGSGTIVTPPSVTRSRG
jgi:hypothetical protein